MVSKRYFMLSCVLLQSLSMAAMDNKGTPLNVSGNKLRRSTEAITQSKSQEIPQGKRRGNSSGSDCGSPCGYPKRVSRQDDLKPLPPHWNDCP